MVEDPVCFVDLAPTLLSLAGLAKASQMQGEALMGPHATPRRDYAFGMRNRMDERYDFVRTATDGRYRYIRNYMPHRMWGMHGAFEWQAKGYQDWERQRLAGTLNPTQARFFGPKPFEEFYDLHTDPDEIDNRIDDPDMAARVNAFRAALDRHMLEINDNGFIPEGSSLEGYENSRQANAYPLQRVMAVAGTAGRGDVGGLPELRASLTDPNEVIRYWAATGLLILGERAKPAAADLKRLAASDPSPHVQVVAAEALVHTGQAREGVEWLAVLAAPDQSMPVRLQALNALTEIGEHARPASPVIAQAAQDAQGYIRRAGVYLSAVLDGSYDPGNLPPEQGVGGG